MMDLNHKPRMFQTLMFLIKMLILSIPMYAVLIFNLNIGLLQAATVGNIIWILSALGHQVSTAGFMVKADGFSFLIDPDCTAWKSMLLFFALVVATPKRPSRTRLKGLLIGFIAIWVVNLARVTISVESFFVFGLDFTVFVHDTLWQIILVGSVLGLWVSWLKFQGIYGRLKGIGLVGKIRQTA